MRSPRTRSVRFRILTVVLIPLLTLVPLAGFAVYLTVPQGLALIDQQRLHPEVGAPTDALGNAVAAERRATLIHIADPEAAPDDLEAARSETDDAVQEFEGIQESDILEVVEPATRERVRNMQDQVDQLDSTRSAVDDGSLGSREAFDYYTGMSDGYLAILQSITTLNDPEMTARGIALARTTAAREELLQEDALLAAGIAAGGLGPQQHHRFVQQVGAAHSATESAVIDLPPHLRERHEEQVQQSEEMARLRELENAVVEAGPGPIPDEVAAGDTWQQAVGGVAESNREVEYATAEHLTASAEPMATGIIVRAGVAVVAGLVGVALSILVSVRMARRLIKETTDLKEQIEDVAHNQLPNLVRRLRSGQGVDAADVGPSRLAFQIHTRELDDLNWAFDEARMVAIQSATGEAKLRQNVNDVIVNLARRNQSLLHRQLKLFDNLERQVDDPDQLRELFLLDHLATRMRRHAEGLLILSGSLPGRGWSRPMPVVDVIRAASTEVEEYTRVSVFPMSSVGLTGGAVTDVIHLLAELIENATLSSPQTSEVLVRGRDVANGFAVEVEDGGLGMSEQSLQQANELLADPPELDLAKRTELGHFVVATLARRHGIKVHLRDSPYGGVTAIVLLPRSILSVDEQPGVEENQAKAAVAAEGRHHAEPAAGTEGPQPTHTPTAAAQGLPPSGEEEPAHPSPAAGETSHPPKHRPSPPPRQDNGGRTRGLPRRVRQANLVPQLRDDEADPPPGTADDRPPEQVHSMMSAMQAGWTRGRNDDPPTGSDPAHSAPPSADDLEGNHQ
ncbi:signal transduction histidine kinase [Lipingzhangella halophila]|uniref:histidine kinase n=1 Tax=Lipingzhangella halophila TaxID=1783352 RepID=A0A7W7RL96_9ACTN|nr:ATP-binding protein [Lipingzhangella halophila]MBB4934055.1 signal transduction histidine kinase [Lipingzhangella halophila]